MAVVIVPAIFTALSIGVLLGIWTCVGYSLYWADVLYPPVQIPRETPMDRAVKISGTLTTSIQNILKEPTINTVWHGQALEQLAKIFDNTTDNLETQLQHKAQKSSMPTTRANIWATPRVHARVTRNNTPGIIPKQTPKK